MKTLLALCSLVGGATVGISEQHLGLYPVIPPSENQAANERRALGERFFFEARLSRSGELSCSTCHRPQHAYSDPRPLSTPEGQPPHLRNAPSLLNVAYRRSLGWDGASRTLEDQVLNTFGPYGDMGLSVGEAISRVATDPAYVLGCRRAYNLNVSVECLTKSLANFQRSLVSADSRFDRFLFGGDQQALTRNERRGWEVFSGRGGCISCHDVFHVSVNPLGGSYATFSDERFHNLGVGYLNGAMRDLGRFNVISSQDFSGAFKTPMLRNVSRTAPYMHDGSLRTLEDVVEFYNLGGIRNSHLSSAISPLFLSSEERTALVAFLKALDSEYYVPNRRRNFSGS